MLRYLVNDMRKPVQQKDTRPVFFFDVDGCLYSQSLRVDALVNELIEQYITQKLGISKESARALKQKYYKEYGLTVIGIQRLHDIDPLEFNLQVDRQLPMGSLLSRSDSLVEFFNMFDPSKVKLWLFTNAYITHGLRVVKLLKIAHFFEGITYCDYANDVWTCKPSQEMLAKAEMEAGIVSKSQCYYVDDSIKNCTAASKRGWQVLWIQNGSPRTEHEYTKSLTRITSLQQIHAIFPQFLNDTTVKTDVC